MFSEGAGERGMSGKPDERGNGDVGGNGFRGYAVN